MKLTQNYVKNPNLIIIIFLVAILLKTCSNDNSAKITKLSRELDSLRISVATKTDLTVEGLKVEKRMIQSTDRKILDVNRQAAIDNELKRIESTK